MLESVKRPDGTEIRFEYDALGRRTAKINHTAKSMYRYLWDGNVILHEWKYGLAERPSLSVNEKGELSSAEPEPTENVVTWVYEEGSFVPSAKLVGKEKYSIISNYLGTPESAYDSQGNKVWSCELDIYGKIKRLEGDAHFVPFRYQGQYYDTEIDLYYNRFRYYSPETGTYISRDPIGLLGDNPNFYAYVHNLNVCVDPFGLEMVTVYHYTSDKGFKSISGSGVIKASDPGARGKGAINKPKAIYVTTVKPEDLQKSGARGKMGLTGDKSTHFIEFQVDSSKLKKLDPQDSKLRLYIEGDINLRDANNKLKDNVSLGKTSSH